MQSISETDLKLNKKLFFQQISVNVREKNSVIINGNELNDVIIVNSDCENMIKQECLLSEENIFQNTLKKIHSAETSKKQSDFGDIYLRKKRNQLNDLLVQGTTAFKNLRYVKALEYYYNALDLMSKDNYPDEFNLTMPNLVSIKYTIALCNYSLKTHGPLTTAESQLMNMINDQGWGNTYPFLYLALANVYYTLREYERCISVLNEGLKKNHKTKFYGDVYWPGSNMMIDDLDLDTVKFKMELLAKECSTIPSPDASCCYDMCLDIGNSQRAIYFDSPAFTGYVVIKCSTQCKFTYHCKCWKKYVKHKEMDILNSSCSTSNCSGYFSSFEVYDEKAQLKTQKLSKSCSVGQPVIKRQLNDTSTSVKNEQAKKTDLTDIDQVNRCTNLLETKEIVCTDKKQTDLLTITKLDVSVPEFVPDLTSNELNECKNGKKVILCNDNKENNLLKNTKLNVSVPEFVPERKVDKKFDTKNKTSAVTTQTKETVRESILVQCSVESSEKSIQTNYNDNEDDIPRLKEFIKFLTESLLQAEDSYNILLKQKKCPCCKIASREWNNDSFDVHNDSEKNVFDTKTLYSQVEQYKMNYVKLKSEMDEISAKLSNVKLELENQKYKYDVQTEALKTQIKLLEQTNKHTSEREEEIKKRNSRLRSIFLQQLNYSRVMHLNYLSSYKDKCNRMIWKMKDLSSITSESTTPTLAEVNIAENNWVQSLLHASQCHNQAEQYYEDILDKLSSEQSPLDNLTIKPQSEVLAEPSNICSQFFTTLLHINSQLNRQIHYQNSLMFNNYQNHVPKYSQKSGPKHSNTEIFNFGEICGTQNEIKNGKSSNACTYNSADSSQIEGVQGSAFIFSANNSLKEEALDCKPKTEILPDEKHNRITSDISLFIQKSYPNIPINQINDALVELRQKHGKLTGMSIRRIRSEVQQILHKPKPPSPKVNSIDILSAWPRVDNGLIPWNSDQKEGECSICYDILELTNTTQLRCKHIFHIFCIRKWLQTNSICPICRVYTMLDDEFPPLM